MRLLDWVAALGRTLLEADHGTTNELLTTAPLPLAVFSATDHALVAASEPWQRLFGPATHAATALREFLVQAVATQQVVRVPELRFRDADDAAMLHHACHVVIAPVLPDGTVRALIATATDTTDAVLARELDATHTALIWSGTNAEADYFNARWQTFTGHEVQPRQPHDWRGYMLADDVPHYEQALATTLQKKATPVEVEARLRRADGTYRWHQVRVSRDVAGRWYARAEDIEDTQHAQKQRIDLLDRLLVALNEAESASRAKDNFLATVSHELRAPVTTIMLWEKVLRDHLDDTKLRLRALDAIRDSASAQSRLVGDLLDVSRAISGKLRLERRRILLESVLTAAVEASLPAATAKQIQITLTCKPRLGRVMADPARLRQVFDNLLSNAVQYTPPGGSIRVIAERAQGAVRVAVADTGRGIEEQFLKRMFTPFAQEPDPLTRSERGLGLGLAITKQLVSLHDGTLTAESPGPGKGATFTVTLPSATRRSLTPPPPTPEPAIARRLDRVRVLVVDDEPRVRDALKLLLARLGAHVESASSAAEARDLLEHVRPDILVCDISMPNEDGYTFIRALRSSRGAARDVPAIALTAYASERDRTRAAAAGFDAHLAKPTQLQALADAIDRLLADQPAEIT